MGPLRTVRLFDLDFIDAEDPSALTELLLGPQPDDGHLPVVLTPNVDILLQLRKDRNADIAGRIRAARYVLPDGQPIVWTSRLVRRPLTSRVTGSSLFPLVWQALIAGRRPTVVVAADQDVADGLLGEHPDSEVLVAPARGASRAELSAFAERVADVVHRRGAHHLLVGLGFGAQERIALDVLDRLGSAGREQPVVMLLGASFQMHLGHVRRAPRWMQRVGAEWLYRVAREPRRLFRRYFVEGPRFIPLAAREIRRSRRHPNGDPERDDRATRGDRA